MAKKKLNLGNCALTGSYGKLVKSHILPQAFTRPAIAGAPLYQSTRGNGELRRWSSWYDNKLVTREGEDLLSEIDNIGIRVLRKHHLVWSSWIVFQPHFESFAPMLPDNGFRKIENLNMEALILFALSTAWRASASSLHDMRYATLEKHQEEELKEFVLGRAIEGTSPFPVSLTQISTIGEPHNHSPTIDTKFVPSIDGSEEHPMVIMRIYIDGLIFHVHFSEIPSKHLNDNPLYLGASDHALVTSVTYEASYQYENMLHVMRECFVR